MRSRSICGCVWAVAACLAGTQTAIAQLPDGDWRMANSAVASDGFSQDTGFGYYHGETWLYNGRSGALYRVDSNRCGDDRPVGCLMPILASGPAVGGTPSDASMFLDPLYYANIDLGVGGWELHADTVTSPEVITDAFYENAPRAAESPVWMYNRITGSVYRVLYDTHQDDYGGDADNRHVDELCGPNPFGENWNKFGCLYPISVYGDEEFYPSVALNPHVSGVRPASRTMGTEAIRKLDALIDLFDRTDVLTDQQIEQLWRLYSDGRWNDVISGEESYHEAFEVQEIYRQDEASFKTAIKKTNQDLAWQCSKVAADFRRHIETGEIPPPYFAMRIAIILRKAKEHEREKRFLAAWCRHFGGLSAEAGATFPQLAERARKLGVRPFENVQQRVKSGAIIGVRNESVRMLIVKFDCGSYGSFKFLLPTSDSFIYTVGEKNVNFGFSDSTLNIPKDAKVIPIRQDG